jgi:hypothetical protein
MIPPSDSLGTGRIVRAELAADKLGCSAPRDWIANTPAAAKAIAVRIGNTLDVIRIGAPALSRRFGAADLACSGAGRKGQRLSRDLLFDLSRESDR